MVNGTRATRSTGKRKATRAAKGNAPGTRRPRSTTKRQAYAANRGTTVVHETETPTTQAETVTAELNAPAQNPKRIRERDFTPAERIAAVTAALTANAAHPTGKRAYEAALASLGTRINIATLHDWIVQYRPMVEPSITAIPVEQTILDTRNQTLANMVKARDIAIAQLLDESKAKTAQYRDNGVVAGILHDKIETATSIRPSLANAALMVDKICSALGFDTEQLLISQANKLQELQMRRLTADDRAMLSTGDQDTSTD